RALAAACPTCGRSRRQAFAAQAARAPFAGQLVRTPQAWVYGLDPCLAALGIARAARAAIARRLFGAKRFHARTHCAAPVERARDESAQPRKHPVGDVDV